MTNAFRVSSPKILPVVKTNERQSHKNNKIKLLSFYTLAPTSVLLTAVQKAKTEKKIRNWVRKLLIEFQEIGQSVASRFLWKF